MGSEVEPQAKLDLPRSGDCIQNQAGSGIRNPNGLIWPSGTVENNALTGRRNIEVRVIEDIEDLGAELHVQLLAQFSPLHHREVDVPQGGPPQCVAAEISHSAVRLQRKRRGIKPLLRVSSNRIVAVARVQVRPIVEIDSASIGLIKAILHCKGRPGAHRDDRAYLPPIDQLVTMEGEAINRIAGEIVPVIETGSAAIRIYIERLADSGGT